MLDLTVSSVITESGIKKRIPTPGYRKTKKRHPASEISVISLPKSGDPYKNHTVQQMDLFHQNPNFHSNPT